MEDICFPVNFFCLKENEGPGVMKIKYACSLKESYDQPRQHITKQRHYYANKGPFSQGYGFSSSHVWM